MSKPYSRSRIRRVSWARTKSVVDLAGCRQGRLNRFLGDFVEDQAMDGDFRLQDFLQMPADRLPFAVFVRRQIQACRPLSGQL